MKGKKGLIHVDEALILPCQPPQLPTIQSHSNGTKAASFHHHPFNSLTTSHPCNNNNNAHHLLARNLHKKAATLAVNGKWLKPLQLLLLLAMFIARHLPQHLPIPPTPPQQPLCFTRIRMRRSYRFVPNLKRKKVRLWRWENRIKVGHLGFAWKFHVHPLNNDVYISHDSKHDPVGNNKQGKCSQAGRNGTWKGEKKGGLQDRAHDYCVCMWNWNAEDDRQQQDNQVQDMDLLLRKMKTTAEDARKWSFEASRYKEEMEVLYEASWLFTHTQCSPHTFLL